jgi:excisionase family DNA binding protein
MVSAVEPMIRNPPEFPGLASCRRSGNTFARFGRVDLDLAQASAGRGRACGLDHGLAFLVIYTIVSVMNRQDVLTTQQVARLLGCSRQHVVDLCDAGKLPCTRIGVHRRLRRVDIEAFLPNRDLRREELRSLWLHRAVAGKIVRDPLGAINRARRNIERFRQIQPRARVWLDEWSGVLDAGPEAVLEMLTSPSRQAIELRQNTPFVGVLSEDERLSILAAFSGSYRAGRPGST